MDTKRFSLDTALTLIAAYLGLFVGLIDANAINLALPAVRNDLDDRRLQHHLRRRPVDSRVAG